MNIIETLSEQHIGQLHGFYQEHWWTKGRTLEETRRCVRGSQLVIGITNKEDQLIAFARVLTDFTFKAMIFDVIVAECLRGQKLGSQLLSLIKQHPTLSEVKHFELYCLPEMMPFYESHGFSSNIAGIRLMRLEP